jgi:hypothetical protein
VSKLRHYFVAAVLAGTTLALATPAKAAEAGSLTASCVTGGGNLRLDATAWYVEIDGARTSSGISSTSC